ncbi:FAD binding domain-containing protein [Evansella tamaricis]|uniref:FAD binding domain-containing protein n=1 Tax=Evansella tamaricis TaxID=2069301 RepID=A0ABS6JKF7_9BACI|nr:FAD binding domain-containing protein [Evansella tamaricis]
MIPFEFEYIKPNTLEEAVTLYERLDSEGKEPVYISGGTEIITLGRLNVLYTGAVIDLKSIPECHVMTRENDRLVLGGCCPLTEVENANPFPLLTSASKEVADHTARTKITLGGNICANIFYREAVLPFLLAESTVTIMGPDGKKTLPINDLFDQTLQLNKGEFLVHITTDISSTKAPFFHMKRRKQWTTGYPLITVSGMKKDGDIRIAISGLCPFPFRSERIESCINDRFNSVEERVSSALQQLPGPILNDTEGSDQFRIFTLKNILSDLVKTLEGVDH